MIDSEWINGFCGGIIVCDDQGIILEINDYEKKILADQGGSDLIGRSLFNCHSEASNQKIKQMLDNQQPNIYIVEKNGEKKLIIQAPWYKANSIAGLVEISLPFSGEIPVIKR